MSQTFIALSCVGFLATAPHVAAAETEGRADPSGVHAPATRAQDSTGQRDTVIVTGQRAATETLESPKATAPLLDTPQTITVVSEQTIRKQNLQTLRDVLQTIPGITFGAGEGGGGYGDSINLRGYSANNDITIDGVRDSAQYSRTDPFNLQQVEVYNGANSVFNGSGSVGGTINLVSKVPTPETLTIAQGSVGTDNYYRGAIDSNVRVSDLVAVRLNGAYHHNDVPGRDVEKMERWGIAPSVTIGITGPTSLTLAYVHQEDRNTPIYGIPYFDNGLVDGFVPGAKRSSYYGIANLDRQDTTVDRFTATFRHQIDEHWSVRNLTRWQQVTQYSVTSAPQGTFCLASTGLQPITATPGATVGAACPANVPAGSYLPSGPRGLVRDQQNQMLYDQLDLRHEAGSKGGFHNVLNVGVSGMLENYRITTASLLRNANGSAVSPLPLIDIANPNTNYTGPINYTITAQSRSETRNLAVYAFDTVELNRYFELNGGVRYETQDADFRALPLAVVPPGSTPLTALQARPQVSSERLFSWRVGGVFHPVENVSLYAGYGNAKTPSSSTVRLGCGVPASATAADPCAVAPETARNYEAGVKAGLFDRKLELTAAVFRNERTNYRVPSNDPALPAGLQVLDGRSRVDGIALGASGTITRAWTIFANYTYLDGKVLQSISNRDKAAGVADPQAGSQLIQTPKHSGSLFTTYKLPFGLEVGYGLTYQGSFATNAPVAANPVQFKVDDYLIHRTYLAYTIAQRWTMQLNVQNFTDEKYVTGVRNNINATTGVVTGGWAIPGDRRQATLSLFYNF
ncbi:TonB-dependent siderophore receptor [Sphingomonas sp. SORGH_AS_0879]|uniref:TonB-dependent receptor n=1 Tax=Sphingomonas sp. SORGH_AS_0879 TaxID=3041790 RepID=UPI002783D1AF|nr:TonB-dependent siderophore receptor [Sphingomonas sp. SORGH_AS_0879]MDQ1232303.1 catecholate siderophore receptor [Sphingomonas sp. SORGH_AS_0879]